MRFLLRSIPFVLLMLPAVRADELLDLKPPALPPVVAGREDPVDRFVDAYFAKHNLAFPPPVDDATFARRVYLDLVGLLPTPQQLDEFMASQSLNKREWLVDQLLTNNVAYADHWLTFWNDLLRNDYAGTGYIDGGRKQITGWLYASLLQNKPYDQFVRQLIAPAPESQGFIKGIEWRGNVSAAQSPQLQFSQNVGQVFLGVNLKCASCHDSFIDDWKLTDSWGMASVIADKPLEMYRCDVPTGKTASPAFIFPELGSIDANVPRKQRLEQLAALITDPRNGRLPRTLVNRLWQRLLGRGIVHPVDAMDGTPWSADLLDYLAFQLTDNGYDIKKVLRLITTSQIYQARCVEPAASTETDAPAFRGPLARRLTAEQFMDAVWRITGTSPPAPLEVDDKKKPAKKTDDKPTPNAAEKPPSTTDDKPATKSDDTQATKSDDKPASKSDEAQASKGETQPSKPGDAQPFKDAETPAAQDDKKPKLKFAGRGEEPARAALLTCDLLMRSLGRPNRDQVVTTRPDDLSTLQALDLTNGPDMTKLMANAAQQWRKDHPDQSTDETIQSLYQAALCRKPTDKEMAASRQILGDSVTADGLTDFMWCLFMLPEFQLIK